MDMIGKREERNLKREREGEKDWRALKGFGQGSGDSSSLPATGGGFDLQAWTSSAGGHGENRVEGDDESVTLEAPHIDSSQPEGESGEDNVPETDDEYYRAYGDEGTERDRDAVAPPLHRDREREGKCFRMEGGESGRSHAGGGYGGREDPGKEGGDGEEDPVPSPSHLSDSLYRVRISGLPLEVTREEVTEALAENSLHPLSGSGSFYVYPLRDLIENPELDPEEVVTLGFEVDFGSLKEAERALRAPLRLRGQVLEVEWNTSSFEERDKKDRRESPTQDRAWGPDGDAGWGPDGDAGWGPDGDAGWGPDRDAGWGSHGDAGWGPDGDAGWGPDGDAGWGSHGDAGWGSHGDAGWGMSPGWLGERDSQDEASSSRGSSSSFSETCQQLESSTQQAGGSASNERTAGGWGAERTAGGWGAPQSKKSLQSLEFQQEKEQQRKKDEGRWDQWEVHREQLRLRKRFIRKQQQQKFEELQQLQQDFQFKCLELQRLSAQLLEMEQVPSLHPAVEEGNLEEVKRLVYLGADVEACETSNGWTPLWIAAAKGYLDIVKFLYETGAHLDTPDKEIECMSFPCRGFSFFSMHL